MERRMSVTLTPNGTRGVSMPMPNWLVAFFGRLMVGLQRLSRGRMKMRGQELLVLTTIGARTSEERTTMLAQFPEPDGSTMVVASFGGTAKHPAWYFNLAKH